MEYELVETEKLKPFKIRSVRQSVLDRLKKRIADGYNPARPLSVIRDGEGYFLTADGNHRLEILQEMEIESIPCIIYDDADPYAIAIQCNQDEDTYAPMDLFDWLDIIGRLRDEGLTQAKIGERIGWSREVVKHHISVLDSIGTEILNLAIEHQKGRVPDNGTNVPTFNFTEWWFRNSGLYDLEEKYQSQVFNAFVNDGLKWKKEKLQKETGKRKQWQRFKKIAEADLVNSDSSHAVINMIENDTFKTESQLLQKISALNEKAKSKLICDDCLNALANIPDNTIDLVITDPPYGIDYSSNRSQYKEHVTKNKIQNDDCRDETLELLDSICKLLAQKTRQDAHFYFFTSWKVYSQFAEIIGQYFTIKNMIVWNKGNHGSGDLSGSWGNCHELIVFAVKGGKAINKRKPDIINVSKLNSEKMVHPTQKPMDLIAEILQVSAQQADTVCDPFMGSGSTIKAVKDYGRLNYIGIEIDREIFEKAKTFIG